MTSLGTFVIRVACQRPFLHILRRGIASSGYSTLFPIQPRPPGKGRNSPLWAELQYQIVIKKMTHKPAGQFDEGSFST